MTGTNLKSHPIHLGLGATAVIEPEFTGALDWYADYAARHAGDGAEGRLVSLFSFDHPWDMWEMHPMGAEVVFCIAGTLTLHQEQLDGGVETVILSAGQYAINPPGVWHTADAESEATALFITAGADTQHRPR
tara:strand:+ start:339 stop:737 length:399 start_codon:yes stop_codon:yes gene_type:complete